MTITEYSVEVAAKLGQAYSLYTTRAIAVLPDAIRQVLAAGQFDRTDLLYDASYRCGAVRNEYNIILDAETIVDVPILTDKSDENLLLWKDKLLIKINKTHIGSNDYLVYASPVDKEIINQTSIYNQIFDDGIKTVYYFVDSAAIIVSNPLPYQIVGKASLTTVVMTKTALAVAGYVLDNVFGMTIIRALIDKAVEILKPETSQA